MVLSLGFPCSPVLYTMQPQIYAMGLPTIPQVHIKIYTSADLQADPHLNNSIVDVVNAAFTRHASFNSKLRFEYPEKLVEQIGTDGLCAVAYSGDSQDSSSATMLGTASLRHWHPTPGGVVDDALREDRPAADLKLVEAGLSYELKAIATVDGPESRGKGLAGVMTQTLLEYVQEKRHQGRDVLLWLQLSEEQNGDYWRRRGYEQVGPVEVMPKGTWGATHDFEFLTMVKRMQAGAEI